MRKWWRRAPEGNELDGCENRDGGPPLEGRRLVSGGREKTNAIHCIVSKSNTRKMPESNGRWVYPNQTACHIHAMIASNECVQRV